MSSASKLLQEEDKDPSNYGSLEEGASSGKPSVSSSIENQRGGPQNAAAYFSLGAGDQHLCQQEISAVSFHDIHYQVKSLCTKKVNQILQGVSGYFPQGVNAIMGPTGSGKTSLLDILAGRKDFSGLQGSVLVNGERQPKNFKCIAGYVVQDDVVMGTLSVRENLHFSAALRLPSSMTSAQRTKRVNKVIKELGLQYCADTKIGTEFIRGVSGGERKRTNIGMELIIEPKVLFLDEPTTGLDANTAVSVVQKLKFLSRDRECTIIMSIHQPRYSIFKLFDTLTLLSQGTMVYHGPSHLALQYFDTLGFPCEEHDNPADFFLDIIIQCENANQPLSPSSPTTSGSFKPLPSSESHLKDQVGVSHSIDLEAAYEQSDQYKVTKKQLDSIMENLETREASGKTAYSQPVKYATNFFWQLLIVMIRSMKNLLRNPMTSILQLVTTIIFALLVGILYLKLNDKEYNSSTVINDRIGAIFFIILNQVFSNLSAIEVFIRQKALFMHENLSGFYRVSVFFVAEVCTDMIPMRLTPLLFYVVITYFMVGFQVNAAKFFSYFLTLALTSMTATSMAFAFSARVNVTAIANLLIAMLFVFSMLFGGFLVSLTSLPVWLRWLKYLSFFRYSIEALTINELAGQCYFDASNFTNIFPNETWTKGSCSDYERLVGPCELPSCTNGSFDLSQRGFEVFPEWLWYDQCGLIGLTLLFLTICYINLLTIKKVK